MSTSGREAMYNAVSSFPSQIKTCVPILKAFDDVDAFSVLRRLEIRRVVCCGMGGSAFPMELVRGWLKDEVLVEIHRDYADQLKEVLPDTLYILLSFSGNTEEVLSCAETLHAQGAHMFTVTNGGQLARWSKLNKVLCIGFPSLPLDFQPRCASGYFLALVCGSLDRVGVTSGLFSRLDEAFARLKAYRSRVESEAMTVALEMHGSNTFILGYPELANSVGLVGRIKFNENAKVSVICDTLPEFNHNQMVAMGLGQDQSVTVLLLSDFRVFGRRAHRLSVCEAYFVGAGAKTLRIDMPGGDQFICVLVGLWILDFASLVLAERRGVDPQEISEIELFKALLNRRDLASD
jgi:glucose/mannose-6-phosphate isomerase